MTSKYRLVTRSDFDGLVCAVLLKELDLVNEIDFVHPKDMQDGLVPVSENDISRVREGMFVKLRFQAHPDKTFEAEILTIPPRSEIRANANVFICESKLSNGEGLLRPGMKGKAKVHGSREILIASLLRPLVNAVRLKLWL